MHWGDRTDTTTGTPPALQLGVPAVGADADVLVQDGGQRRVLLLLRHHDRLRVQRRILRVLKVAAQCTSGIFEDFSPAPLSRVSKLLHGALHSVSLAPLCAQSTLVRVLLTIEASMSAAASDDCQTIASTHLAAMVSCVPPTKPRQPFDPQRHFIGCTPRRNCQKGSLNSQESAFAMCIFSGLVQQALPQQSLDYCQIPVSSAGID